MKNSTAIWRSSLALNYSSINRSPWREWRWDRTSHVLLFVSLLAADRCRLGQIGEGEVVLVLLEALISEAGAESHSHVVLSGGFLLHLVLEYLLLLHSSTPEGVRQAAMGDSHHSLHSPRDLFILVVHNNQLQSVKSWKAKFNKLLEGFSFLI